MSADRRSGPADFPACTTFHGIHQLLHRQGLHQIYPFLALHLAILILLAPPVRFSRSLRHHDRIQTGEVLAKLLWFTPVAFLLLLSTWNMIRGTLLWQFMLVG